MNQKIKYVLIGLLVGFILFPTVTLGGTFVSSLIQGKSAEEAIQILADQIDSLTGRVTAIESKVSKDELCQQAQTLYTLLPPMQTNPATGQIMGRAMASNIVGEYTAENEMYQDAVKQNNIMEFGDPKVIAIDLNVIKQYYDAYMSAKAKCDGQ